VTRLQAGWPGFGSRQGPGRDFLFSPPRPDRQWSPPSLLSNESPGAKRLVREADSSPSSAQVMNTWSCTSTSPYVFIEWYLGKHMDTSTLPHFFIYCVLRFIRISINFNILFLSRLSSVNRLWNVVSVGTCLYAEMSDSCTVDLQFIATWWVREALLESVNWNRLSRNSSVSKVTSYGMDILDSGLGEQGGILFSFTSWPALEVILCLVSGYADRSLSRRV